MLELWNFSDGYFDFVGEYVYIAANSNVGILFD